MKKLMTLTLAVAAAIAVQAADTFFRVDVNGIKENIALTHENSTDMNIGTMGWLKDAEQRKCSVTASSKQKLSATEWKNYSVTFTPAKSGKVTVGIIGQWAAKPENMGWVLVNNVKVNDQLYKNGDFKKTYKAHNGTATMPSEFWLNNKAAYCPTAGDKGTPAILVNHNNQGSFSMPVEAGKKYKLTFSVKAGSPDQAK